MGQDRVQRGDQGLAEYFQKSSQVIVVRIAPRPIESKLVLQADDVDCGGVELRG